MRVVNIHGAGDVRLDERADPAPGPRDVVIRVKACGICGSDLSYIAMGGVNRPEGGVTPLGHEAAGEIVAVGAEVTDARPGQRVVINPMNTPSFVGNGGPDGAFTEEVVVRDARMGRSLLPIGDDLPYDVAALTEPLAVALHGINRGQARAGEKVVVFGCGPIGLGMIVWLRDRGVEDVLAVDLFDERLDRATALGATHVVNAGREDVPARIRALHGSTRQMGRDMAGTDLYLDAAGAPHLMGDVVKLAKVHARYVVTAAHRKPVELDLAAMLRTEMTITTAVGYPTEMDEVLGALPRLRDTVAPLISHRLPFEKVLDGFALAATPGAAKVMIDFTSAAAR